MFMRLTVTTRYFKQDEKGVAAMCKIMENMRNEAAQKANNAIGITNITI